MILKKHKNDLLKIILEERQDISKFEFATRESSVGGTIMVINYVGSPMDFWIYPASHDDFEQFKVSFKLFAPSLPESEISPVVEFEQVKALLKMWLTTHLKKYSENEDELDYWKIIKENPLSIEGIDFSKNEPFKIEEREQLRLGIEEIKILIQTNFELNPSEIELTHKKLDYLIEATNRLNKTDWKGIAISTLFTITYDLSFDEHKRSMLFGLFSKLWAVVQHLPLTII